MENKAIYRKRSSADQYLLGFEKQQVSVNAPVQIVLLRVTSLHYGKFLTRFQVW